MNTETMSKLFLELSQFLPDTKTARELQLEKRLLANEDMVTIGRLLLHDTDKGWAKISSGLFQNFTGGLSSFNVRHDDGAEYRISFKIEEIETESDGS